MEISLEQLTQLAEAFRNPNPKYAALAEVMMAYHARTPAQRRADTEEMLGFAAQIEVAGGEFAEAAGKLRRSLAAELFCGRIADNTPFASRA